MSLRELLRQQSCVVMGILNVTPDSFSDGGRFNNLDAALRQAEAMHLAGASIIDVGGESTRPGAEELSDEEELDRVVPVLERIKAEVPVFVSVDTKKTAVMAAGVSLGVDLVNDVNALRAPGAVELVSRSGVLVCLMHMKGDPSTMQQSPEYFSVVDEVKAFLCERVDVCLQAGISKESIILDPGFGFGKSLLHNYELFAALPELVALRYPILVGVSRKSMIGELLGVSPAERVVGSAVLAAMAVERGARVLRVHDVPETMQAVALANAACARSDT